MQFGMDTALIMQMNYVLRALGKDQTFILLLQDILGSFNIANYDIGLLA